MRKPEAGQVKHGRVCPREIDMAKVYLTSRRDAGLDCDFQARGSSVEEVMQLCADHGAQKHNMKAFGPELYMKMRGCVKTLEEWTSRPTS
jgi:predicted small metal-binding protein